MRPGARRVPERQPVDEVVVVDVDEPRRAEDLRAPEGHAVRRRGGPTAAPEPGRIGCGNRQSRDGSHPAGCLGAVAGDRALGLGCSLVRRGASWRGIEGRHGPPPGGVEHSGHRHATPGARCRQSIVRRTVVLRVGRTGLCRVPSRGSSSSSRVGGAAPARETVMAAARDARRAASCTAWSRSADSPARPAAPSSRSATEPVDQGGHEGVTRADGVHDRDDGRLDAHHAVPGRAPGPSLPRVTTTTAGPRCTQSRAICTGSAPG